MEPWITIKWELPAGNGVFKFSLFVSHTVRSRVPLLPLGYPGVDIFGRIQGHIRSLDDDGFSRNNLGVIAAKER